MSSMEIYLDDLIEETQREYLSFVEADSRDDINDLIPIAVLDYEGEE